MTEQKPNVTIDPRHIGLILEPGLNELHLELDNCRFFADTPNGRREVIPTRISDCPVLAYEYIDPNETDQKRIIAIPSKRLEVVLANLGYELIGEHGQRLKPRRIQL